MASVFIRRTQKQRRIPTRLIGNHPAIASATEVILCSLVVERVKSLHRWTVTFPELDASRCRWPNARPSWMLLDAIGCYRMLLMLLMLLDAIGCYRVLSMLLDAIGCARSMVLLHLVLFDITTGVLQKLITKPE